MSEPDPDLPARTAVATRALELLEPGMTIGLGSGRAVWKVIEGIAERFPGRPPLRAAVASSGTEALARGAGLDIVELDGTVRLDLVIDGADEIDHELGLLKGGGAALLREKLVVSAAERFVVVAEERKRVERLGLAQRLPVEVVHFAWGDTRRRVLDLLPGGKLREVGPGVPVRTDEGHLLIDCHVPREADLPELAAALKGTVGVVEHGLFLELADTALLGRADGSVTVVERSGMS